MYNLKMYKFTNRLNTSLIMDQPYQESSKERLKNQFFFFNHEKVKKYFYKICVKSIIVHIIINLFTSQLD